ncbi:MAG: ribosome small subunit-dependent GTPase A [Candidatus Izemoplasmatales bacterium]
MKQGRIIKLIGGIYTVVDESGQTINLKPIGLFRYQKIDPKVGDFVRFDEDAIKEVMPRTNDLVRPSIANVDQALLVASAKRPDFSTLLLDKFLALVEYHGVRPVIIVSKVDLLDDAERQRLENVLSYYAKYFEVILFSTKTGEGREMIENAVYGKVNVLTGQTGAGKSSLLNVLDPSLDLATDDISEALGRGKHTTRHTELIPLFGGWIADTPGFSKLDFTGMEDVMLKDCYPDFLERSDHCRFHGCLHVSEPGCAVKDSLSTGEIPEERYQNYRKLLEEVRAIPKRY